MTTIRAAWPLLGQALLFTAVSSPLAAYCDRQIPDFTIESLSHGNRLDLKAIPPAGYHFKIAAPAVLTLQGTQAQVKPMQTSEEAAAFQLILPALSDSAILTLMVCDKTNEHCDVKNVKTKWKAQIRSASRKST